MSSIPLPDGRAITRLPGARFRNQQKTRCLEYAKRPELCANESNSTRQSANRGNCRIAHRPSERVRKRVEGRASALIRRARNRIARHHRHGALTPLASDHCQDAVRNADNHRPRRPPGSHAAASQPASVARLNACNETASNDGHRRCDRDDDARLDTR